MKNKTEIGEWKRIMVSELTHLFKENSNFYISGYQGLKSEELNELKRMLEPLSCRYMVLKNSIARLALKKAGFECVDSLITGSTAITYGDDILKAAKVLSKFSKSHESLELRGGYIYGETITPDRISYIASLPTKEELLTKTVILMKSPLTNFVFLLKNVILSLVLVLNALVESKRDDK